MTSDLTPWLLLDRLVQAVSEHDGRSTRKRRFASGYLPPVHGCPSPGDLDTLVNQAEAAIALVNKRNKAAAARRKQGRRIGQVAK